MGKLDGLGWSPRPETDMGCRISWVLAGLVLAWVVRAPTAAVGRR